jgi:hypothetical protein
MYHTVVLDTDDGDLTLTVTGGYNADGDTSVTFADAGDFVLFHSIKVGTSYYWRAIAQEGTNVALEEMEFDAIIAGAITGGDNSLGITGQTQATTVDGGAVAIAGAASIAGATGAGGAVTIAGGASGSTNGAGGAASLTGGLGTGTGNGGAASLVGGVAGATGNGGAIAVTGGASAAGATGTGGAVAIAGGANANTTNGAGGAVSATGGAGKGTGAGGAISVTGGASGAGATGNGGAASLVGGAATSTAGDGGDITITGGGATTTGTGGDVTITSGIGGAGGNAGDIRIDTGAPTGGTDGDIGIGLTNATAMTVGPAINFGTTTGTDTIVLTLAPALTAYVTGQMFVFKPGGDNTGACTLNVNGLGATNIKTQTAADPAAADIDATGIAIVVYDGTNMVLINPATTTD